MANPVINDELRDWNVFFDRRRIELPSSMPHLQERLIGNIQWWKTNYIHIFVIFFVFQFLSSQHSLLPLVFWSLVPALFHACLTKRAPIQSANQRANYANNTAQTFFSQFQDMMNGMQRR